MDLTQSFYGNVAVRKLQKRSHSFEASQRSRESTACAKKPRQGGFENRELGNLDGDEISDTETQEFQYNEVELSADPALDDRACLRWSHPADMYEVKDDIVLDLKAMKHAIQRKVSEIQHYLLQYEDEAKKADIRRREAEQDLRTARQRQKEAQRNLDLLIGNTLKSLDNVLSSIEQTGLEWLQKSAIGAVQSKP